MLSTEAEFLREQVMYKEVGTQGDVRVSPDIDEKNIDCNAEDNQVHQHISAYSTGRPRRREAVSKYKDRYTSHEYYLKPGRVARLAQQNSQKLT